MHPNRKSGRTNFVSFSGIDGAGKSTQIEALCARLAEDGLRVQLIRFWHDIARLTNIRETAGHKLFSGDKGVGSPSTPINRRDKNVRSWLMTWVRLFIYFVDANSLRAAVKKALRSEADLVIFDRYIYDELANLTLHNRAIRAYVGLIMRLVPRPDISFLLDADPLKARARKPEYPLEYLSSNRESYLALCDLVGGITVISPMPISMVKRAILMHVRNELSFTAPQRKNDSASALRDSGGEAAELDGRQEVQPVSDPLCRKG